MGEKHDNVNHPDHYQNIAGVEAIDILNDVVKDLPGKQASMLWNTLKYLLRFQKKNGVEDLKKAQNYLQWLIDDVETCMTFRSEHPDLLDEGTDEQQEEVINEHLEAIPGVTVNNANITIPDDAMKAFGKCITKLFREAWRSMQHGKISENLDNFCEKAKKESRH